MKKVTITVKAGVAEPVYIDDGVRVTIIDFGVTSNTERYAKENRTTSIWGRRGLLSAQPAKFELKVRMAPLVLYDVVDTLLPRVAKVAKAWGLLETKRRKAVELRIQRLQKASETLVNDLMFGDEPVPQALEKFAAMGF